MKKNYILDTNVLIQDENAIFRFEDNDVYIPNAVVDELNLLKEDRRNRERAAAARAANRIIRDLLNEVVAGKNGKRNEREIVCQLKSGGAIHFVGTYQESAAHPLMARDPFDSEIIVCANQIRKMYPTMDTILVTNDNGMANRAMSRFGMVVQEYRNIAIQNVYTGRKEFIGVPSEGIRELKENNTVSLEALGIDKDGSGIEKEAVSENEFLELRAQDGNFCLGRVKGNQVVRLVYEKASISGIIAANVGQNFAAEALMLDINQVPLAIIQGPAGTGKTLLALAAGLKQLEQNEVKQILLLRPNVMIDDNDGALPGTEQEKIDPMMRPYWDNLRRILSHKSMSYDAANSRVRALVEEEKIRVESFSYIRGRSILDSYIILDEAQNLLRKHAVGILTRAGENSKLVLIGDPTEDQIDNPYVNENTNGLVYAMNLMKDSPYCAQTSFYETESRRSALVRDVVSRLKENKLS